MCLIDGCHKNALSPPTPNPTSWSRINLCSLRNLGHAEKMFLIHSLAHYLTYSSTVVLLVLREVSFPLPPFIQLSQ